MTFLAVAAEVGQRLDCGHLVAQGRGAWPLTSMDKWGCSPGCRDRMARAQIEAQWRSAAERAKWMREALGWPA